MTMTTGCSDVCEVVHDQLLRLGFPIDHESDDHTDILEALGNVRLVRLDGSGSFCPECGARMEAWCRDGTDACYQCTNCDVHWEYVDGAYRSTEGSTNCDVHGACETCSERDILPHREEKDAEV